MRAQAQDIRITYFEPLNTADAPASTNKQAQSEQSLAETASLSFDAFGRRFELQLERNERLTRGLARAGGLPADVILYKGTVVGLAGSWVRLTSNRGVLSGAVWDGTTLYGVEQYDRVASRIDTPSSAAAGSTIIYRWSDTVGRVGDIVGGASSASATPMANAAALSGPSSPAKQVDIGLVADVELAQQMGAGTQTTMLSIINVVDGIFSEQVGVHLNVANVDVEQAEPDPFSSSDPSTLLQQVTDYKASTPALRALGLAHLFTGRTLSSNTTGEHIIGIASLGTLCNPRLAVGLTQATAILQPALVAAHEIGHIFGAPHDAEPGSVCESTPGTFLMNPTLNGSEQFSDCSLQQIQRVTSSATCLIPLVANDVSVRLGALLPAQPLAGQGVAGTILVENPGPSDSFGVRVNAVGTGMTLTPGQGLGCGDATSSTMICIIDRLGSGTTTTLSFSGNTQTAGAATIDVHVVAPNDPDTTNNDAHATIDFAPAADLHFGDAVASPMAVHPGEESVIALDVTNTGASAATNALVNVSVTPSYELVAVSATAGSCAANMPQDGAWTCSLGTLAHNQSQHLSVRVRASAANMSPGAVLYGSVTVQASTTEPLLSSAARTYDYLVAIATAVDDLAVEITPPIPVATQAPVEVVVVTRNDGPDASGQFQINVDFNSMAISDAATDVGPCLTNSGLVLCTVQTLGVGQRVTLKAHGTAGSSAGSMAIQASLSGGTPDVNSANNVAHSSLTVSAPAPLAPPPTSGGGGGAADPLGLLALLAILVARRASRRSITDASVLRAPHIH